MGRRRRRPLHAKLEITLGITGRGGAVRRAANQNGRLPGAIAPLLIPARKETFRDGEPVPYDKLEFALPIKNSKQKSGNVFKISFNFSLPFLFLSVLHSTIWQKLLAILVFLSS